MTRHKPHKGSAMSLMIDSIKEYSTYTYTRRENIGLNNQSGGVR